MPTALADGDQTVRYDFTYYAESVVATLTTFGGATRQSRALLNAGRDGVTSYVVGPNSIYNIVPFEIPGSTLRLTTTVCYQRWTNSTAGCH